MKTVKQNFNIKKAVGITLSTLFIAAISSCSTDEENLETNENVNLSSSGEQFATSSNFIPDPSKVYTITSATSPLLVSTSSIGFTDTRTDIPQPDLTVRDLWVISPSTIPGSYFIDSLGDISNIITGVSTPRLSVSTSSFRLSPTFEENNANDLLSSWDISVSEEGGFLITNLADVARPRLTSLEIGFSAPFNYGLRLTEGTNASETERFVFTEVEFPFATNRAPITSDDSLAFISSGTRTIDVVIDDFDPDGDELTLISFEYEGDDRISVEMTDSGELEVSYNTSLRVSGTVTYTVSDGNGATSEGILNIFRRQFGSF